MRRPPNVIRILSCVTACVAAAACRREAVPPPPTSPAHLVERVQLTMGSELHLTAWTADEPGAIAAFGAVFAEFDRLDRLLSVWKEGSDILKLNAAAGDHPVPVADEVREVLTIARQVSDWTDGKFDVTFGALSDVWKFDQDQDNRIPAPAAIRVRLPFIDYQQLVIDEPKGTAFLKKRGMRAHLGGIGKGYAVDRGAAIMRARGFHDFIIQSGGDLYLAGQHGDRPWRASIRDPRGPADQIFAALDLSDGTFSTSGDYERFFMKDGVRYHHIMDPDVGQPARLCRSVTIVSNRAVIADGLSTGVFILGPEKGMALIEKLPDVEGVIVSAKNDVLVSSGLKGKVLMLRTPTDEP